jgi:predicted cupin superfamily sugar epimerase
VEPEVRALIERFDLRPLPLEGTLFAETYRSNASSAIVALYAVDPPSRSCFHVLTHDEVWHAYAGDPFHLILLHPDGSSEDVVIGRDVRAGHHVQFTVPAGTWQAGELLPGSRYALFGCTMAPGFTPECFLASPAEPLIARWPGREADIRRLAISEASERTFVTPK